MRYRYTYSLFYLFLIFSSPLYSGGRQEAEIKVPWFGQEENRWADDMLGDSSTITIGTHGCALTASSMVLAHRGIRTNPAKLNRWLLKNNGFDTGRDDDTGEYLGKVRIIWDRLAEGHSEISLIRRYDFINLPADMIMIRSYLDQGIPVIAEVVRPGGIQHFVVLTGYRNADFLIRDPLDEETEYLSDRYNVSDQYGSGAERNIYGIRVLVPAD